MKVIEAFEISGRGLGIVLDTATDFPIRTRLLLDIRRPDGRQLQAKASKEWIRIAYPSLHEQEAFVLAGLAVEDAPLGSDVLAVRVDG